MSTAEFRGSRLLRVCLTGLALCLLAAGTVLILTEGLPRLLGLWISMALRERHVEPEILSVERAGPTATRLAPGSVSFHGQSFSWQSLEVDYTPVDLWSGRVEQVYLGNPRFRIKWPVPMALEPTRPEPGWEVIPEVPVVDSPPVAPSLPEGEPAPSLEESDAFPGTSPTELASWALPDTAELLAFFESLPLDRLSTREGDFGLTLFGQPEVTGNWEAFLLNGPDLLTGRVFIDAGTAAFYSTVSGVKSAKAISIHSDLNLEPAFVSELKQRLSGNGADPWGHLDLQEELSGEILFDWVGPGLPAVSAEAQLGAFTWIPFDGLSLTGKSLMVLGTYKDDTLRLSAGCRVDRLSWKSAQITPFSIRGSFTEGDRIRMESERFTLTAPGWSGQFAVRGSAHPSFGAGIPEAQVELAFTNFEGPFFTIEPASVLFRSGAGFSVRTSPIGLKRRTTLWVEDLSVEADHGLSAVSGGFSWFNSAGALMGGIAFHNEGPLAEGLDPAFQLQSPSGDSFMQGRLTLTGKRLDTVVRGDLPIDWLNALNDWGGWFSGSLTGSSPTLDISLTNVTAFPRGTVALSLSNFGVTIGEDVTVEGISGEIPLKFLGLPASPSEQQWTISAISTSGLTIRDIRLRWSLPTMRTLRIHELKGNLGGGTVSVEPFDVDPFDPELVVRMQFSRLQAGLFLDWYGEDRFAIEGGALSGGLGLQWRDGVWLIGKGGLRIDPSTTESRFVFSDEAFLREQFVNLTGVPEDLKRPLLSALLRKGIRIQDLELQLEPVADGETVSLKLTLSGETVTEEIEVPIRGLVINNLIAKDDLARLLGLFGPIRFLESP